MVPKISGVNYERRVSEDEEEDLLNPDDLKDDEEDVVEFDLVQDDEE